MLREIACALTLVELELGVLVVGEFALLGRELHLILGNAQQRGSERTYVSK